MFFLIRYYKDIDVQYLLIYTENDLRDIFACLFGDFLGTQLTAARSTPAHAGKRPNAHLISILSALRSHAFFVSLMRI